MAHGADTDGTGDRSPGAGSTELLVRPGFRAGRRFWRQDEPDPLASIRNALGVVYNVGHDFHARCQRRWRAGAGGGRGGRGRRCRQSEHAAMSRPTIDNELRAAQYVPGARCGHRRSVAVRRGGGFAGGGAALAVRFRVGCGRSRAAAAAGAAAPGGGRGGRGGGAGGRVVVPARRWRRPPSPTYLGSSLLAFTPRVLLVSAASKGPAALGEMVGCEATRRSTRSSSISRLAVAHIVRSGCLSFLVATRRRATISSCSTRC